MDFTSKQKRNIVSTIGDRYRVCMRRMESLEAQNAVSLNMKDYRDAQEYVNDINRTLLDCTSDTKLIIRKEFLCVSEPGWYQEYFSRNTYYRLRKKAVEEFLNQLDA